jgi:hypothetical protein
VNALEIEFLSSSTVTDALMPGRMPEESLHRMELWETHIEPPQELPAARALTVVAAAEKYMPLSDRIVDAVVESTTWLSPVRIGVGYVKVKLWMDCCVAAMTVTSLFVPDPVFGAKVFKKVSDVQASDSAGDPANDDIREDAKMSMLALSIVIDAVSVVTSNFHVP